MNPTLQKLESNLNSAKAEVIGALGYMSLVSSYPNQQEIETALRNAVLCMDGARHYLLNADWQMQEECKKS